MTEEIKNNESKYSDSEQEQRLPEEVTAAVKPLDDEEDNIATPEDMEEFIRSRRERREAGKKKSYIDSDDEEPPMDYEANESAMDPYLEPDPTLPKVEYKESIYLSRGCNHCPESYTPVSETELRSCCKVGSCNWMKGIRQPMEKPFDCVEVRFKNNRKEFYRLPDGIDVSDGDIVAVEGIPGHDVGIVSLTGEVCRIQMLKKKVDPESDTIKKLFRRAKVSDIERWTSAIREEENTLKKTRQIAEDLGLVMKVNDVEYQGDHSKAIFYYTADDRVDFRNLIKVLAEQFHVRIEMKQIGVRQEAGKVGGIGTCGRELCCSTWLTNFRSVTTASAKTQQILPNPQKLAGQCGKLKCCLNFEYEVYADALKKFPPAGTAIRFQKGLALYKKTDVFRGIMWYAYEGESDLFAIPAESVKEIIEMNRNQRYPEKLEDYQVELMSTSALAQESTDEEVEREIQRLAEGGNGVVGEQKNDEPKKGQHNDRQRNDRHNNRHNNHGNRQPNGEQQQNSDRQQNNNKPHNNPGNNEQRPPKKNNDRPRNDAPRRSGGNNRDRRG